MARKRKLGEVLSLESPSTAAMSASNFSAADYALQVSNRWHGRETQISLLSSLFTQNNSGVYGSVPPIVVYGISSTGKTGVVKDLLQTMHCLYAFVDCVQCHSQRLLLNKLSKQLQPLLDPQQKFKGTSLKTDRLDHFARLLRSLAAKAPEDIRHRVIYLVFDAANRLQHVESAFIQGLLKLHEYTNLNVCCLFLTETIWPSFWTEAALVGSSFPVTIFFPPYSRAEMVSILERESTSDVNGVLYRRFLDLLFQTFEPVCRDLNEFRYLANLLFPKYIAPLQQGKDIPVSVTAADVGILYKHISPYFRRVLQTLFHHDVGLEDLTESNLDLNSISTEAELMAGSVRGKLEFELPLSSKYLLLSSYLASYNPVQFDKQFFTKQGRKRVRKSSKSVHKSSRKHHISQRLLGPKSFGLDRMVAIYQTLMKIEEYDDDLTADVYSQITSLVNLGLLSRVSTDILDAPKLKCNVSFDFISILCRNIKFKLSEYLYDPGLGAI